MSVTAIDPAQLSWIAGCASELDSNGAISNAVNAAGNGEKVDFSKVLTQALDKDSNGQISQAEWQSAAKKAQNALSSLNGTNAQARAYEAQGSLASNIVSSLDSNGDGSVSQAESGLVADDFKKLDTDNDGKLSVKEIETELKESASPADVAAAGISNAQSSEYARILNQLGQNAWSKRQVSSTSSEAA